VPTVYLTATIEGTKGTVQKSVFVEPKFFWKALFCLLAFDVCGFGRNFPRLYELLHSVKTFECEPREDAVEQVCGAINKACVWYPKTVLCLQRSAVTTYLLRRLGIPAKVVLGAQTIPFKAHAWTEVNGEAINERRDVKKQYIVWDRC
jgi:hypothetical protein